MGELAASFAHELNQPLSAIVANAQAAHRFLAMTPPDLREVDDALGDITGDAKRAGAVIRRMRELMRRGDRHEAVVDIDALVKKTVEMLRSDAASRKVSVTVASDEGLAHVSGDAVQLQQVILNLAVNAFEAISQADVDPGLLTITTSSSFGRVKITFDDNGPGFPDDPLQDPFAPFVTTKPEGLGMGLSISRTIVEAHRGTLLAEGNAEGGARLRILLPVSTDEME
jgi:two-component system sensor kinase FixL